ncbi:DUF5634 family protein [Desertibacillus haloalkaliphilus]|uniref:DUF5634 family protein n=1 Tax=Desertibacillus haloalkaliphilus TaxID=1328930 RepID=UPI001C280C2B|nr:DUF5634 family protein [Desertibacillus haloalkaliphilus]MBU8905309.1 DUF5634 family protein [Desertibacillus haloalkaliphilus]
MDYVSRDTILNTMTNSLDTIKQKYNLDDIDIREQPADDDRYYFGYKVEKGGKEYTIHLPYVKNEEGEMMIEKIEWIVQGNHGEEIGYSNLDEVFSDKL